MFDRFQVNGLLSPPEACQGVTELGIINPKNEFISYLRSIHKVNGLKRSISFLDFLQMFLVFSSKKEERTSNKTRRKETKHHSSRYSSRSPIRERREERHRYESSDDDEGKYEKRHLQNHGRRERELEDSPQERRTRERSGYHTSNTGRYESESEIDNQTPSRRRRDTRRRDESPPARSSPRKPKNDDQDFDIDQFVKFKIHPTSKIYKGYIRYYEETDDTYHIDCLDRNRLEKRIKRSLIRKAKEENHKEKIKKANQRNTLREGMKVEARYRGKSRFYPGVISRERPNGTFDINYDDGEKETGVSSEMIRKK